ETRRSIRELRTLLVEIYPPNLRASGLASALVDLVVPLEARKIVADVSVEPDLQISEAAESLIFRTAREAIRNVISHANATRTSIGVSTRGSRVVLTVEDDGRGTAGFTPREGHLGLRLVRDLAEDMGGTLEL